MIKKTRTEIEKLGNAEVEVIWITTEDNAVIAITHITAQNKGSKNFPVILVHGNYSRRNFWISPKGKGMGAYLAENGFDVWVPELRGHGLSPKGDDFPSVTAEDQIRFDIPAVQNFVFNENSTPCFWIGHSIGGLFILGAVSAGWLDSNQIRGFVSFGSQITKGEAYLKIPSVAFILSVILKRMGTFPAPKFGLGPEVESAGTMIEMIRWKKFLGKWATSEGTSYWDGLKDITFPVLSFAAEKDKNDPPEGCRDIFNQTGSPDKTFKILGKKHGFSNDYDHIGMVVSSSAQAEIWPMTKDWLKHHC